MLTTSLRKSACLMRPSILKEQTPAWMRSGMCLRRHISFMASKYPEGRSPIGCPEILPQGYNSIGTVSYIRRDWRSCQTAYHLHSTARFDKHKDLHAQNTRLQFPSFPEFLLPEQEKYLSR